MSLFNRKRRAAERFGIAIACTSLIFCLLLFRIRHGNISVGATSLINTQRRRVPSSYATMFAGERGLDAVLFLASLAIHHPGAQVYISSDSITYEWYLEHAKRLFYRLDMHWTLAVDKYNMTKKREEMEAAETWNEFMLEKVAIMEKALTHHNDTMFLDADFVLLEPIYLPPDAPYQLGVSPHYMKAYQTNKFGYYNGGMLWTNQLDLGSAWRKAAAMSRYFEQAAIEDLTKQYNPFFEFGPEHNVGFWRPVHDEVGPKEFYSHMYFDASTQTIMLRNRSIVTFHTHILSHYPWAVGNKFSELFLKMLRMSNNPNYELIAEIVQWAKGGCIPPQMVI